MPLMQVQPMGLGTTWNGDDGLPGPMLGGKNNEGIVAELHGKYYTQNYRGKLWCASITTATAIPLFATNATPNFCLWNPAGNNTAVVLTRFNVGFHGGTGVAGAIGYAYLPLAGSGLATAGPISAFTAGPSILSGIVGQKYGGNIQFGSAATLTGTGLSALTVYRYSSLSQGAPITSTAAIYNLFEEFDGTMIIPPGILWCPVASVAIAETFEISVTAYEIPFP